MTTETILNVLHRGRLEGFGVGVCYGSQRTVFGGGIANSKDGIVRAFVMVRLDIKPVNHVGAREMLL